MPNIDGIQNMGELPPGHRSRVAQVGTSRKLQGIGEGRFAARIVRVVGQDICIYIY